VRRRIASLVALGVTVGLLAVLPACSTDAGATVTVTQQVPPAPTVPTSANAPEAQPDTTASETTASETTAAETTASATSTPKPTSSAATSTSKQRTSKSATTAGDPDPGWTNPTTNDPDVSRDVPGPEGGRKCATDAKYYDEAPTGMRPDVIAAWHHFEKVANAQGIIVCLNDGKRSSAQQQAQYDEYVQEYGKDVADQLVLSPEKSSHVTGNALDVQPQAAYQFLQSTKGSLGLCRIYDNEPWHFEYDAKYFTQGCPARLPKPEN
jgi:LAS superfamily LD-carboxypeptidase LdcB